MKLLVVDKVRKLPEGWVLLHGAIKRFWHFRLSNGIVHCMKGRGPMLSPEKWSTEPSGKIEACPACARFVHHRELQRKREEREERALNGIEPEVLGPCPQLVKESPAQATGARAISIAAASEPQSRPVLRTASGLVTAIETVTDEVARQLLATNHPKNRAVRESWVEFLAEQIRQGTWKTSHQGIAISDKGELLDGQHRLHAVVLTGIPIRVMVTRNVPSDTFRVMDGGVGRTHFDRLHLVNDPASNRRICTMINSFVRSARRNRGSISVDRIEDEFLQRTESWAWVADTFRTNRSGLTGASVLAAFAIYHSVNPLKAAAFVEGYRSMEGLANGSPISALIRSLQAARTMPDPAYWKTVSATRAHLDGRRLEKIMEATEDLIGNKNSINLIKDRRQTIAKGNRTRHQRATA